MLGGLLDITIGLVFIYLLLSLICTATNELIAGILNSRARNLVHALGNLLNDDDQNSELERRFYNDPFIKTLSKPLKKPFFIPTWLYTKGRIKEFLDFQTFPSYIPSKTFATVLLGTIVNDPEKHHDLDKLKIELSKLSGNDNLKNILLSLIADAEGDFDKARKNVEVWFNDSMARVSGWYKKKTQMVVLFLAVAVTTFINADTIEIARTLSVDAQLREALVAQAVSVSGVTAEPAEKSVATSDPEQTVKANLEKIKTTFQQLEEVGLPLGWQSTPTKPSGWVTKLFGLLLTSLAVSLGAPFWFDTLKKVVNIRATGVSPEDLNAQKRKQAANIT